MIDSTDDIIVPLKSEQTIPSEDFSVKDEPIETNISDESSSDPDKKFQKLSCSNDGGERRGKKRSIESEDYCEDTELDLDDIDDEEDDDDLDRSSINSDPFREDLDEEDSGEDKAWSDFPGIRMQRGSGRLSRTYGLRPRSGIRRSWVEGDAQPVRGSGGPRRSRGSRGAPKSKYRRNTANARERDRMKEINIAFANLRGALPSFTCRRITSMTKIKTLKLAASYIRALSDLLSDSPSDESKHLALQLFQDLPEENSLISSIKQSLGTSIDNFDTSFAPRKQDTTSSNSNIKNTLNICLDFEKGSISDSTIVHSRPTSALEAALSGMPKSSAIGTLAISSSTVQQPQHLATRSHLIVPPPLCLSNQSVSSLTTQQSLSVKSPIITELPNNIPIITDSPSSNQHGSTVVTANVNVISIQNEKVESESVFPLTPINSPNVTSPVFRHNRESVLYSPQSNSQQSSAANTHFTFSGLLSPATARDDQLSKYEQPTSKFVNNSTQILENSIIPPNRYNMNNVNQKDKNIPVSSWPQRKTPLPYNSLSQYAEASTNTFNQHHVPSDTSKTLLATSNTQLNYVTQTSNRAAFLATLSSNNISSSDMTKLNHLNTRSDLICSTSNIHQDGTAKLVLPSTIDSVSPPLYDDNNLRAVNATINSPFQYLPNTSQLSIHNSETGGLAWNSNMNIEINSLLKESECVSESSSVNWDELCWAID